MTVTSTTSRVSYTGNGATTVFSVPFYFLASSHLAVTVVDAYGGITTLVLNTDYTVTGAGVVSGGSITCTTAPAFGTTVVITRNVPATQETDYQANDPFPAATHEAALDKLTMLVQQQSNTNARALTFPLSDDSTLDATLPAAAARAGRYLAFDANGEPTSEGVLPDQIYLGAAASDPATRNDGTALQAGDLYFSTTLLRIRAYSGTAWVDVGTPAPLTITVDYFSGNASTTAFTLSVAPAFQNATEVFISGVAQQPGADYTISGTTLTFTTAPPTGTNNIMAKGLSSYAGGVPNDGSVTTSKISDGAVTAAKREAGDGGNRIINGGMRISQRYASATVAVSAGTTAFVVDRWNVQNYSGTASLNCSRSTDVPSATNLSYSLLVSAATGDASVGTTERVYVSQTVEGYNAADLLGKTFTVAFWVKASKTGIFSLGFRSKSNSGVYRYYAAEYTVNVANTWEYKTVTLTGGLDGGTSYFDTAADVGVVLAWALMAGTSYTLGPNAWGQSNSQRFASTNQINAIASNSDTFQLTGVALHVGTSVPPYEERPFTTELQLCQRYYQKSYALGSIPGGVTSGGVVTAGAIASTNQPGLSRGLQVQMRTTPTVTFYSSSTGASGNIRNVSTSADVAVSSVSTENSNSTGFAVLASAATAGHLLYAHYTAEAEL